MFENFRIRNYRSFRNFHITENKTINIFTGKNNTGKSSLLEAIFLNCGASNSGLSIVVNQMRGENRHSVENDIVFRGMINVSSVSGGAEIVADWRDQRNIQNTRTLSIKPRFDSISFSASSGGEEIVLGHEFIFRSGRTQVSAQVGWVEAVPLGRPESDKRNPATMQLARTSDMIFGESNLLAGGLPQKTSGGGAQGVQVSFGGRAFQFRAENPANPALINAMIASGRNLDIHAQLHAMLVEAKKKKFLVPIIAAAKIIEPRVVDIAALSERGADIIYVDVGYDKLLPLHLMGGGFINILHIISCIESVKFNNRTGGVVLIDELEDGIHYSVMPKIAKFICEIADSKKVQLFITTHSHEMLSAFSEAHASTGFNDLCAYRLVRDDDEVRATRFSASDLASADDMGLDLR